MSREIEDCKNWPEADELERDIRANLDNFEGSVVEMSLAKLFDEVDRLISQVQDEAEEARQDLVSAEDLAPVSLNTIGFRSEPDTAELVADLHAVADHARHLVEYLDGDRPEVDTDDLRFRLRRLGFSVNATMPAAVREEVGRYGQGQ